VYRARHEMVSRALAHEFADYLEAIPSAAGLHVAAVARNPSVERVIAVVRRASDAGVGLHELSRFAVAAPARPGLVLGYGAIPTTDIDEGLSRLRKCFDD
jgi:GntR family transcriptional regulator / MocR family aminotransferase